MGYMHIENLYRLEARHILMFKQVYVSEKIHGTSAHIAKRDGQLHIHHGGINRELLLAALDQEKLLAEMFDGMTVYGEAYGGKCQAMAHTYGKDVRFIAFEVHKNVWFNPETAEKAARGLGLDFVPQKLLSSDIEVLDAERDKPSEVAERLGMGSDKLREGIVIRPPFEATLNNGGRIIAKHKNAAFHERLHQPKVTADKLEVLTAANAIAEEWVTPMRLVHVLQNIPGGGRDISQTREVINHMLEDVLREASGEIVDSADARRAISSRAAKLFKEHLGIGL